jgi:hypothetical protein
MAKRLLVIDKDISSMAVIASDARIADIQPDYPPRSAVVSWLFFETRVDDGSFSRT